MYGYKSMHVNVYTECIYVYIHTYACICMYDWITYMYIYTSICVCLCIFANKSQMIDTLWRYSYVPIVS